MICQSTLELFPQGMSGSCGNQVKTTNVNTHAAMDADVPLQHPLQQDGSFNQKSEFRKAENLKEPVTKGEKFNVAQLSLLREFWRNNYAHVIWTVEAYSLPTDEKSLLDDCGLVRCHSSRSNGWSVHARIGSTGYVRLFWESKEDEDENGHAAIFEAKFGKKTAGVTTDSRGGAADSLFDTLEFVALAVEGSDLSTTEQTFVPTASCIRSGPPRLRCCVCHRHHKRCNDCTSCCSTVFQNGTSAKVCHFQG